MIELPVSGHHVVFSRSADVSRDEIENESTNMASDRCHRLPILSAQCDRRAPPSLPKWFYDPTTNGCRRFEFFGCRLVSDNDNSFESLEDCLETCVDLDDSTNGDYSNFVVFK